ncbi:hypothetical protein MPTK1_1g05360 [Marchantia polymorpha subsp. ruderalis]|uniref:3D domain-containing protein n=2 Tax=Marchantia polymorpha TaxID=3197 RepID=A0AAF6ALS2_MARPO|nr:hypothetical protein MARPO_0005s0072 [Marchantia polymorpha]BBM97392.1 hypothetical protein Mp_1g05360 [Marchantia polymorpha subsp. ruderalis]|eukprot:PTQ48414.1 hypothetical protein MARPO_0005s0072 [Marchantia polymorpha]
MAPYKLEIETTAYCSCGYCCNWEWGIRLPGQYYLGLSPSWAPLKLRQRKSQGLTEKRLPLVSRYWTTRNLSGYPYYGLTSNGSVPAQARPPLFSGLSLSQYQKLPGRLLLFPWRLLPRHGSIAADTDFYPFGTKMFVPGYGWGEVEDRGGAIKGKTRIDLYHHSHQQALKWGRRRLPVLVILPGDHPVDRLNIPRPLKSVLHGLNWFRGLLF